MSAQGFGALVRGHRKRRPPARRWTGGRVTPGNLGPGCLSQSALGKAIGYDTAMIHRIETGERLPSLPRFARLVATLDLDDAEIAALVRAVPPDGVPS